jgi:hypothetical protein
VAANIEFWRKHPGLVWSNPEARDEVYIRAALLHPRFTQLLAIAMEFGVDRLRHEWVWLEGDETPELRRARHSVQRILSNIEKGFAIAAEQN